VRWDGTHRKERKGRRDFLCSLRSLRPLRFSNCTGGRIVGQLLTVALQSHGAQESRWFCQLGISAPRVTSGRRFPPSGDIR